MMTVDLRRVDIQLLLVFMLIFPGLGYIYTFHRDYYLSIDAIKLLSSSISISLPFVFLGYMIRTKSSIYMIFRIGILLQRKSNEILKTQSKLEDYKKRLGWLKGKLDGAQQKEHADLVIENASLRKQYNKASIKVDNLRSDLAQNAKNFYKSSLAVDIPLSVVINFVLSCLIYIANYYLGLKSSRVLELTFLTVIIFTQLSNYLIPNLRDYYDVGGREKSIKGKENDHNL